MADNRQYTALEWVVKEIKETLSEAQRVLESYSIDSQDITQLRFCQTLIHQVYGSLQMVGFHGAAMLAEEMEALSKALFDGSVREKDEALEVLMRAILQLPDYLERVQETKRDYPAVVLSLLNDIRSVRGESLLSESTLFNPDLDHARQQQGQAHRLTKNDTQLQDLIVKLRQMYRYAAASAINQINVDENLSYLIKVTDRLKKILQGTKRSAVWDIAHAVIDGLHQNAIQPTPAIKNLLRDLDAELRQLQQNGSKALTDFTSDDLLKNLLYYISSSDANTSAIEQIKAAYKLNQLSPLSKAVTDDDEETLPVDSGTLQAVASAIREEFEQIKVKLDDSLHGTQTDENLDFIQNALQRVNDTLAILGVGELRQMVNNSVIAIANLRHQETPGTNEELLEIAHGLVEIETKLDSSLSASHSGSSKTYHLDEAQSAVLDECRNGLEKSKDAIVDYIATQWDIEKLQSVPEHMRQVRGNLLVLSLGKAADILSACILYIEKQLIGLEIKPKWQQLDSLADVIASVDYYLEFMSAAKENDETILDKAEKGLVFLGVNKGSVEVIGLSSNVEQSASPVPLHPESVAEDESQTDIPSTESTEALDEEDDLIDEELTQIFVEEVGDITLQLAEYFPQWAADYDNENALTETRRAFHTLKGSGRMVKAVDIGELAWSVENMLNRVIDHTILPDKPHIALVTKVIDLIPDLVSAYENRQPNPHQQLCEQYMAWGHELSRNERSDEMLEGLMTPSQAASQTTSYEEELSNGDELVVSEAAEIDAQLWEIFQAEAEGHLSVVAEYIAHMDSVKPFYEPPSDLMQRALHTLKGSAYMADLTPIAELMAPLEKFAKELRSYQVSIDDDILQLIKDGVSYTHEALSQIAELTYPVIPKSEQFLARIEELRERSVGPLIRQKEAEKAQQKVDPAVLEVLMAEEMHLLLDADLMIEEWQTTPASADDWQPLRDELANLCHGAERANLQSMASLSRSLQQVFQELIDGKVADDPANYGVILRGHSELMNIIDAIAAGQDLPTENVDLLESLSSLPKLPTDALDSSSGVVDFANQENPSSLEETADEVKDEPQQEELQADQGSIVDNLLESQTQVLDPDEVDEETVEIFLEEAHELLEELDETIHDWENGAEDNESNEALQRALHTLKGGARLSGLTGLGDLAHNFEAYLIENSKGNQADNIFNTVHDYQDQLIAQVGDVNQRFNVDVEPELDSSSSPDIESAVELNEASDVDTPDFNSASSESQGQDEQYSEEPIEDTATQEDASVLDPPVLDGSSTPPPEEKTVAQSANILPFTGNKSSGLTVLKEVPQPASPNPQSGSTAASRRNQPQEMVKVSADLMEELVNLAGETSISRGRMEEQVTDLGFAIEEMGSTVQRLQEQLRRLDIETEAQIIFRQEQLAETEDFDPLEMDRYSQLQQLSRSLIESASDLMDLKGTLVDKTRDAETVLLQQSRINTDLQEGLMRSRMVPFSRIVPRLRRIVRQISTELNKDVNLELGNIEGELDRSMMERMVAPLEHMLRNAIDHGLEDVNTRTQLGKPATGRIVITLDRDGGDVLILVADDGRGIDVDRVREKAIERNLMNSDANLSDQEILQFILHAGFSTAETITQISGRGVGMDVVNSEIRQMGGSIGIDSRSGEGTAFTIRVPFTVSVNRALMITMGEDRYAIPLNTIEGIVRISPFELEHYYANPDEPFEYANQEYQLRHLGTLLDPTVKPRLQGHTLPLPVLLVRSADHSVAVQVDNLQGSREIVVKSLGPQFRSVLGVSGATIMGDGHVVVILDTNALIRSSLARSLTLPNAIEVDEPVELPVDRNPLVMVVDDSVTVRKVTSRLLEREGYDVITAKDGVDAMTQLQDQVPDIMLLDIEMPRMDGFEVAKNVRSSSALQHLPIIMITSRTGEKHRQRGLESGANLYMGKPYQEEKLLEGIRELTDASAHKP
ncbi:MAG: Hpt domain-containing protein [Cellvibrionaceae bacterium]